jgi:hypothetical protein
MCWQWRRKFSQRWLESNWQGLAWRSNVPIWTPRQVAASYFSAIVEISGLAIVGCFRRSLLLLVCQIRIDGSRPLFEATSLRSTTSKVGWDCSHDRIHLGLFPEACFLWNLRSAEDLSLASSAPVQLYRPKLEYLFLGSVEPIMPTRVEQLRQEVAVVDSDSGLVIEATRMGLVRDRPYEKVSETLCFFYQRLYCIYLDTYNICRQMRWGPSIYWMAKIEW